MKPLIVPFVIALVASLAVASGASVVQARRAAPHVIAADSGKAKLAEHDSGGLKVIDASGSADAAVVAPDTGAHEVAVAATPSPVTQQGEPAAAAHGVPAVPAAAAAVVPALVKASPSAPAVAVAGGAAGAAGAAPQPTEKRVSRVFASMTPRDAAKVLEQMSDPDVSVILGNLADKQAAAIMAQLPPPRVAALSRVALRPTQGAK